MNSIQILERGKMPLMADAGFFMGREHIVQCSFASIAPRGSDLLLWVYNHDGKYLYTHSLKVTTLPYGVKDDILYLGSNLAFDLKQRLLLDLPNAFPECFQEIKSYPRYLPISEDKEYGVIVYRSKRVIARIEPKGWIIPLSIPVKIGENRGASSLRCHGALIVVEYTAIKPDKEGNIVCLYHEDGRLLSQWEGELLGSWSQGSEFSLWISQAEADGDFACHYVVSKGK